MKCEKLYYKTSKKRSFWRYQIFTDSATRPSKSSSRGVRMYVECRPLAIKLLLRSPFVNQFQPSKQQDGVAPLTADPAPKCTLGYLTKTEIYVLAVQPV